MTQGHSPQLLALDFDGVICDGLKEYFQSSKRTYLSIWPTESLESLEKHAASFYQLRPVVTIGWEMPVLLKALVLGIAPKRILNDWSTVAEEIVSAEHLDKQQMMQQLDQVRDQWIETDLSGWLSLHRFYPGIIRRLNQIIQSTTELAIITTKEGRFVRQLLQQGGLDLPNHLIFGKEVKRPKWETLEGLIQQYDIETNNVWFIEDLLKTLHSVEKQKHLRGISLFLADWGYNTQADRDSTLENGRINLLSLKRFEQDFSAWRE